MTDHTIPYIDKIPFLANYESGSLELSFWLGPTLGFMSSFAESSSNENPAKSV